MDQNHNDLTFSSCEWAAGRLGPSPSHCGVLLDSSLRLKYLVQQASDFHSSFKREVPVVDLESGCKVIPFYRTPPSSSLLSPLSLSLCLDSVHLDSIIQHDGLQSGFERSCASDPPRSHLTEDDEALSPLDWATGHRSLLASPFSEDSDSDDGLAPSPFSSPESISKPETDEETGECLFFPSSTQGRGPGYQHLGRYSNLALFQDRTDDASLSHSPPFSSPTAVPDGPIEDGLQSPSLSPTPLPVNPFYYFDHPSSAVPDSPRYRAVDLPALENETDSKAYRIGLGLHSMGPLYPFGDFHSGDEVSPPPGFLQRTTWLSLPGADTDDDLIPAELGSKTYIPDPSITIPTTPPSRSLLIWDPTTRSGLPAGLPSFDGTGHTTHRLDVDALPIARPHSPEEDFDVDPALLAKLAAKDAEKGVEVQKLCDLKQRTNFAACKSRDGAQFDVERVREKCREVTALLRLKLASDQEATKTVDVVHGVKKASASGGAEGGGISPPSAPLLARSSIGPSIASISSHSSDPELLPESLPNLSTLDCSVASPSTSPRVIQRRTSKPKITSMAQLVANMVFHRQQQDVLRRSPTRSRTWSPPASITNTTASGKTRSWTQISPTSPLRQMILPEDLDGNSDSEGDTKPKEYILDSPLQLSPLCLSLCESPESFYAQLGPTTSVSLSTSPRF